MKKRFACLMLTLVLLIGLIPTAAIPAAATTPSSGISEAGIRVIKESVGFRKDAYDAGSGVYKIGYGTPSTKGQTITEANADILLRKELAGLATTVEAAMATPGLTQKRLDALVWLAYTEGGNTSWAVTIKNLLASSASASQFASAICTYNWSAYVDNDSYRSVLARRMAIANLFIAGTYSASNTGSVGYTLFYAGDGMAFDASGTKYKIQVFYGGSNQKIEVAAPSVSGYSFLGWYNGNALVSGVGSATSGKTLTARWQKTGGEDVKASYTLAAYVIYKARGLSDSEVLEVLSSPNGTKIDEIKRDATVTVVAERMDGSAKWLNLSTGGWVKLYDNATSMPEVTSTFTVTVTDDYVNIRATASANADKLGVLKRGEEVTIFMKDATGSWGYCSKGWIFLAYTSYQKNSTVADPTLTGGTPGVVTGAAKVNVRTAAGVTNPLATQLNEGTRVTVYEQTTVNNAAWGHIDQGWISMGYVKLEQSTQPGGNISTGSSAVVSSSVSLNVRSGPGAGYTKVATLAPGTSVVILRKEVVNGVAWGLIDQGWINLNYVTVTASSNGNGSVGYGVGGTVVNCSTGVNIRSAAGTANALIGVAPLGSRVTVTERVMVNGFYWGHIDRGWVCMDYIQLDSEFVEPGADGKDDNTELDNVVTTFQGYPAVIKGTTAFESGTTGTKLYASASYHSDSLMTLSKDTVVNILAFSAVDGGHVFGKVTVGDKTGWVNMADVTMKAFNAKVTAAKADVYQDHSVRSGLYTSLVKGTYVTIGKADSNNNFSDYWALSEGVLWGKIGENAWINMSNVTMFKENTRPEGITTMSGVGYMTGTLNAEAIVYLDNNGNVAWEQEQEKEADGTPKVDSEGKPVMKTSDKPSAYTLPAGSTVNVQARVYGSKSDSTKTYAKVAVGSVVGWIEWDKINLTPITMKASTATLYYSAASVSGGSNLAAGSLVTIMERKLVPYGNEINHGVIDMGRGYIGDDRVHDSYWFVLDDGKLAPTTRATTDDPGSPAIAATVVVSGTTSGTVTVYEEAMDTSNALLTISSGNLITVLNWRNVGGVTWGKVQINKIVGWVKIENINFGDLKGIAQVEQLQVYNMKDKTSAVQVLRVNNQAIAIKSITFDGTTLWGEIEVNVNGKAYTGYVDLANLKLNTPKETPMMAVIAKGKVNSVSATVSAETATGESGGVVTLAKGTEVELDSVKIDGGKAKWRVKLGDKLETGNIDGAQYYGWLDMDQLKLYSTIATITSTSASVYNDLTLNANDIMYTLYRGEKVTVIGYMVNTYATGAEKDALFGEVVYGNTTGWIQLTDKTGKLVVSLVPGSTGTTIGGDTNPTNPTTPTTPAEKGTAGYIVCSTTVNVRSGAGVDKTLVTTLPNATAVKIYEKTVVLGKEWARIDQGWVCMDYVREGTLATNVPGAGNNGNSGSVSIITTVPAGAIAVGFANQDVNVRSGSGLGYPETGTVKKNNSVVIYEIKLDGGMSWGRTDNGWVCVSYLTITGIGAAGSGSTGTIATGGFTANVRGTSNSNGALMAKVMVSSKVVVRETAVVGAETWVRTDLGWINGQYVVLDSSTTAPTNPTTPTNPTIPSGSGSTTVTEPSTAGGDEFVG